MTLCFDLSHSLEALNAGLFVSPGFGIHAKRIIDSHELIFVTQGRLDMFEESQSFSLQRNQTVLLFPGLRHGGLLPYTADLNFYWVHFRIQKSAARKELVSVPKVATIRNPDRLTELFRRFTSDQESGTLDPLSAEHLVSLMLCDIGEEAQKTAGWRPAAALESNQFSLAERVQVYLESHFRDPISSSSIAAALHYNPDYLERIFHARANMSILGALHQERIGIARNLLQTEAKKNIKEIAFQCGYRDSGYFSRMFKRLTGLAPRDFRTLYTRTHINTH